MEKPLYNGSKRCSRDVKPPATMCSVPQDVITYMLGFLNILDICCTAMFVNKQFERLSRQAMLQMEVVNAQDDERIRPDNEEFWRGFGGMILKLHKTLKKIKGASILCMVGWKQLLFNIYMFQKLCYSFFFIHKYSLRGFQFSIVSWACVSYVN